jgi:hypothetical protein
MKKTAALLAAAAAIGVCSTAYALYSVTDTGTWPKSWPAALEPLRKQARSLVGPTVEQRHYAIRFTKREEFEAAWPQLLKVKSKGAPIFLLRGPNFFLGDGGIAGVVVHCPPEGQAEKPGTPEGPIPGVVDERVRWMNTNYLDLVVDGEIVDLRRIRIPAGIRTIDERSRPRTPGR